MVRGPLAQALQTVSGLILVYLFRPDTHWHEVSQEAWEVLSRAGYQADRLRAEKGV